MSKGLDMLRDYIEHDALCMRRRKCCEIEDVLMKEMDALKVENAKLRELAKLYADAVRLGCDICPYCDPYLCDTETEPMRDGCRLWEEMRELGIEATDA